MVVAPTVVPRGHEEVSRPGGLVADFVQEVLRSPSSAKSTLANWLLIVLLILALIISGIIWKLV